MKQRIRKVTALMAALALAGFSSAHAATTDDNTTLSSGQQKVATKFASPFATLAGSQENAVALATALRTGTPATLTYTTIVDGKPVTVTQTITVPTRPMGWGNVSHALALAQYSLTHAGITQPTAADLQAALNGGKITTSDGKVITLDGVLAQRASGMGWGQIARSEGTTMGAVNHGLKAPTNTTLATSSGPTNKVTTTRVTTAGGTAAGSAGSSKGLTTAGGTPAGSNAGAKGLTTASGATSGSGIVTASGAHAGGNSAGHGIVTAGGGGGGGQSADHGNGKGKGGG